MSATSDEGYYTLTIDRPNATSYTLTATAGGVQLKDTTCGNLTRFDVVATRRTKAFHHYSVGGELTVESSELLDVEIESVTCRWCSTGGTWP